MSLIKCGTSAGGSLLRTDIDLCWYNYIVYSRSPENEAPVPAPAPAPAAVPSDNRPAIYCSLCCAASLLASNRTGTNARPPAFQRHSDSPRMQSGKDALHLLNVHNPDDGLFRRRFFAGINLAPFRFRVKYAFGTVFTVEFTIPK